MAYDTALVVLVAVAAIALRPDAEAKLHRFSIAWRLWKNGYSWHTAWILAEGR